MRHSKVCAIRIPPVLLFWFYTACTYDILQVILSIFLPKFTNLQAACSLFDMPVLVMFVKKRLDVLILQIYNRLIFVWLALFCDDLWATLFDAPQFAMTLQLYKRLVFWMICPILWWSLSNFWRRKSRDFRQMWIWAATCSWK